MATHPVELTLKSLGSGDDISERKLLLFPNHIFPVGRASKSIAKKLLAEHDNAWVDSPVISRNHAQFTIGSPSGLQKVFIRDTGSMHGTIVNMKLIQKHENHELSIGDVVQFGTSVVRGQETFAAPKFLIDYKPLLTSSASEISALQSRQTCTKRRLTGYAMPEPESSDEASEVEGGSDSNISGDGSHSSALLQPGSSQILFPDKPDDTTVSAPGSQANPVTIIDDTEIVHDSVSVVDADEMRCGAHVKNIEDSMETNQSVQEQQDMDTAVSPFTSYKQPSYASEDEVSDSDDGEHVYENSILGDADPNIDNLEEDTASDFSEAETSLIMPSDRSESAEVSSSWDIELAEVTKEDLFVFDDLRSTQADVDAREFEDMESILERNQDLLDAPGSENRDVRNKPEDMLRDARKLSDMHSTIPTQFENDRSVQFAQPTASLSGSATNTYTSLPPMNTVHPSHPVSLPSLLGRTDPQAVPRTDVPYPRFPANAEPSQNRNPGHWYPSVRDLDFVPVQRSMYSGPVFNLPPLGSVLGGNPESSLMDNFSASPVYFPNSHPMDQTRPLVEGTSYASGVSPASRKRKANEMLRNAEQLPQDTGCACVASHDINVTKLQADTTTLKQSSYPKASEVTSTTMPSDVSPASEPSAKRVKLGYVATAAAGTLVGGIGMLAALISLPDTFFQ